MANQQPNSPDARRDQVRGSEPDRDDPRSSDMPRPNRPGDNANDKSMQPRGSQAEDDSETFENEGDSVDPEDEDRAQAGEPNR